MMKGLFGLYLCWLSAEDLREYRISVWKLLPGIALLAGSSYVGLQHALPGVIAVLLALASRGRLGCGDGAVILLMGLLVGGTHCICAVMLAIFLICTFLIFRGGDVQTEMLRLPGIPFLTVGYLLSEMLAGTM
ncbi:MAG: hypothetical protein Q4B72_10505 [Lachnospiraceae bacterium]|nr:hypothetical protein [Lachnospiraceae bacterium]